MPQAAPLSSRGIKEKRHPLPLQGSPCTASAQHCCPPSPPTIQPQRLQPLLQECQDGGSPLPSGGGGSAMTGCAGAGEVPCTPLLQELLSLQSPGADGSLGEAARPPVPRASPCQPTRSAELEPWYPGCLLHPPRRVDHRPIPSYPKGNKSHGRQDFGQALPSSLPSAPNLHSQSGTLAKRTWRLVSPDLAQQLCPLPILHGQGTRGLVWALFSWWIQEL